MANSFIFDSKSASSAAEAIEIMLALRDNGFYSFRGQRNHAWPLGPHHLPEPENSDKLSDTQKRDGIDNILDENRRQFVKRCRGYFDVDLDPHNFWESQFLAQHHGLKTRLLDWTSNPLVALYFAVEDILSSVNDDTCGCVWAIKVDNSRFKKFHEIRNVDRNAMPGWMMIHPPLLSPRMIAQSSKFSYHPAQTDLDLRTQLLGMGEELIQIKIEPGEDGKNPSPVIRKHLGILNIHHASLFPDPDGIARFVNQQWRSIARSHFV